MKQHKYLSQEEKDKIAAKKKPGGDDKDKGGDEIIPFMDTEGKDAKVEALICIWKIDQGGQLMQEKEQSFCYNSLFKPTMKG